MAVAVLAEPEPVPMAVAALPVPVPVEAIPDSEPEARAPAPQKRRSRDEDGDEHRAQRAPERRRSTGNSALLAGALCAGALVLAGLAVGGYYAFRDKPKEEVKDPAPPKAPAPAPKQALTHEQMIRKVKASTVYIRSYFANGRGTGSGFFAGSKPGFIVTNAHVVGYGPNKIREPEKVEVIINSGETTERTLEAKVFGVSVNDDLALLRVDEKYLPAPLPFGRAEALTETQELIVFGYPFGESLGRSVSVNRTTVSSLRKSGGGVERIQLAGGLNPGNSGGPVANEKGEIVGVSVASFRGAEAIDFAIPAETAKAFTEAQIRNGGEWKFGGLSPP
jgi:S1-C subfamily serine protease